MPPEEGRRIRPCRSLQDLEAAVSAVPLTTNEHRFALLPNNDDDDDDENNNNNNNNGGRHDGRPAAGVDIENDMNKDDLDEDDSDVLAFYDEFRVPPHHLVRHMSISDVSINEHSPLLNPLKSLPRGTPKKIWFHRAWRWYNQLIDRWPVMTKSITAGIIVALGDATGQWMERTATAVTTAAAATAAAASSDGAASHNGGYDVIRTVRFCAMGIFLQAPVTHYYYHALDVRFPPTEYPWTWTTLIKLIIDQSLFAPTFLLAVFLFLGIFEGETFHEIMGDLKDEYWSTMTANWKLWIPATLLNLAYVAPQYRVLYCNLIFFVWSIFLSLTLSEEHDVDATCLSGC